jgi:hypothetical protein
MRVSDALRFLTSLFPTLEGRALLLWGAPSKRSAWVTDLTDQTAAQIATWAEKENVYVGCALRRQPLGPTLRGERADCVAIPGLWLDIDYGTDHKKPNLPPTEADALALVQEMGLAPSIVVHSGRGLQAWWLFREPWVFETDAERDTAERMTKAWCNTLRAKAKAHGWDADQVGDLPRVMRVPGTWNRKGVPVPTRLLSLTEARYNLDDFEPYLTQGSDQSQIDAPNLTWTFELSPTAEPPVDKFLLLSEIDATFRASWTHTRTDLQDQSASSYDLSLATRACGGDRGPPEVVNLLIAHRRKHKEDLKLRADYYTRTLSKAVKDKDLEARRHLVDDLKAGKALPEQTQKDPAELLGILSGIFEATITKLIKYEGEVGVYEMEINGQTVKLGGIEVLTTQRHFRNKIADTAGVWFPLQKPALWDQTVSIMLKVVERVDVGQEATAKGALSAMLDGYLAAGVMAEDKADEALLQHQPALRGGSPHFTLTGLRQHLLGQYQEKMTTQQLSVQLRAMGYQGQRIHVMNHKQKTRTTRFVWGKL